MITVDFVINRSKFDICIHETFHAGITGIFGPSGSGKTSILNAIAGLIVPQKGTVTIQGKKVYDSGTKINIPVHKRHIGYVFQSGRLFPHMSVEKNLRFGMNKNRPRIFGFDEVVKILKLENLLKCKPSAVSGGEYQRAALGRALLSSPDILLLDEPFSAVDVCLRSQIIPYLLTIQHRIKIPMLVVSHELSDLLKLTNRLCIINDGKCIGHDDYQNLINSRLVSYFFGTSSILNSIDVIVDYCDFSNGISILKTSDQKNDIRILCEKSRQQYSPGQKLKIFIKSQDIALSSHKLTGVSIQNQLEGSVVDIFDKDASSYCVVDTGFKLIVEITAESSSRLNIHIGSTVWCLFKSLSIDVAV